MSTNLMEILAQTMKKNDLKKRAKTVSVPMNSSRWRIMPSGSKENAVFWHDFGRHFIKDSTGKIAAVYMCVDKTYGKPCSVCTAIDTTINHTDDPELKELLTGAKSSRRVLLNALPIDGPLAAAGDPVILEIAPSLFEQIIAIAHEWDGKPISVDKDGMDLVITREGSGKLTKYSVQLSSKSKLVDPAIMNKITNLEEYVAQESEEAANRALTNIAAIAGLLPAPSAPVRPALSHAAQLSGVMIQDIDTTDVEDEALRKLEIETVEAMNVAKAEPAKVVNAAPAAEPVFKSTGDAEIDEMVRQLEQLGS